MKRIVVIFLIFALLLTLLCACNGNQADIGTSAEEPSLETGNAGDPENNSTPAVVKESGVSDMKLPQTGRTGPVPAAYSAAHHRVRDALQRKQQHGFWKLH